jgi:hypothetical protein
MGFSYVAGVELGRSIAEVLGINVDQVHKMTIEMDADGPAHVIVEAWVPDDNGVLVEQISRYRLAEDDAS